MWIRRDYQLVICALGSEPHSGACRDKANTNLQRKSKAVFRQRFRESILGGGGRVTIFQRTLPGGGGGG